MKQRTAQLLLAAGAAGIAAYTVSRTQERRRAAAPQAHDALPAASVMETLGTLVGVFLPTAAKGVIIRRPAVEGLAERADFDRAAIRRLQRLRDRHGSGPLMLRLPIRKQAVLLDPSHVRRILAETPDPFATDSSEKSAALAHLQPRGVLISHDEKRASRRKLNDEALANDSPVHPLAQVFLAKLDEEAAPILDNASRRGELTWEEFSHGWERLVRRVVFGDAAADDETISDMSVTLRRAANWAFLRPPRKKLRAQFLARISAYIQRAEPGSLTAVIASLPKTPDSAPEHQVPQWLFAFDPAAMATFRALALLSTHPEQLARAQEEIRTQGPARHSLPFLRAALLESLRLWSTTPLVLRQTTRETQWEHGRMPAGTGVAIFTPFFHRNERLPYADRFNPDLWMQEGDEVHNMHDRHDMHDGLIPFSAGPGICPGRHLVLLLGSAMLATLLRDGQVRMQEPERLVPGRLPATLDHYSLRFSLSR